MKKICLLSITASHYRFRIYDKMQKEIGCEFIFGIDNTSVKRLDTEYLINVKNTPNIYICNSPIYYQSNLVAETKQYDIIINDLGIFSISSWILLLLAKFREQKIYHWDHGWYGRENFIKKYIKRLYFGLADGAFIYGDYAIKLMEKNGFNKSKLHAIHNSLDYERHIELRNNINDNDIYKKHFNNSLPTIIMIGRLNSRKKIDFLFKALALLKDRGHLLNLVLIGEGEDEVKLRKITSDLNLSSQVWFYGACYDEKINANLIYNSDLCVVPGDIGLTAIHVMTFGVPVITHNYYPNQGPEFEVIKEGITGAFYEHNDINSLTQTIENWFKIYAKNREQVRINCYKEIDNNWTPQYQIDLLKRTLKDA